MPDPAAPNPNPGRHKDPNFLAVVAAAMVVALLFFAGAWLFVRQEGRHLLPPKQFNHEPHSCLRLPEPPARPA